MNLGEKIYKLRKEKGLSIGIFGFVYSAGTMESYELLVHNDNYSSSFWFKIRRKARTKMDKW